MSAQNGKGSAPRNCFSKQFKRNHEEIDWRKWRRLIQDDDGHWYVIPCGEEATFEKWCAAQRGSRHIPAGFAPARIDGPHAFCFKDWKETQ